MFVREGEHNSPEAAVPLAVTREVLVAAALPN
jgi:hypothetical protein